VSPTILTISHLGFAPVTLTPTESTTLAVLLSVGCSQDAPTAPTRATTWNLTGTVRRADTGAPVAGASVAILDGPNAGRVTATSDSGAYTLLGLTPGGFSLRAQHADYFETAQAVDLTSDRTLDFGLTKRPRADLMWEGVLAQYPQPPGYSTWDFAGHGVNRGDGCATAISGTVTLLTALGQPVAGSARTFSLPSDVIVRPLERFDYRGCCHSTAEVDQTAFHATVFTWTDASCP
jgi:hypothetical protein